jgi:hypothetical protein
MKVNEYQNFKKGDFALVANKLVKIVHFKVYYTGLGLEYGEVFFKYVKDDNSFTFNASITLLKKLEQGPAKVLYGSSKSQF